MRQCFETFVDDIKLNIEGMAVMIWTGSFWLRNCT